MLLNTHTIWAFQMADNEQDLVYRLRKRAEIRRQIPSRKSVEEGKPDRIANLLDEAAIEIGNLRTTTVQLLEMTNMNKQLLTNALDDAILAIDDWINTYAEDLCDEDRVAQARQRLNEHGTLHYLATVVQQCRDARESLND